MIGVALLAAAAVAAPAFHPLIGTWEAACELAGAPATCRMMWAPGLHPLQLTLSYEVRGRPEGERLFAGRGVYRLQSDSVEGVWSDSQNALHSITGVLTADALTTSWGSAATEQGRSEYRLEGPHMLNVTDRVLTKDGWRTFMQVRYQRVD